MKLFDGLTGRLYEVKSLAGGAEINNRLEAMGIRPGTKVLLMHLKSSGSLVIKVRGSRLALGREIVNDIDIKEAL